MLKNFSILAVVTAVLLACSSGSGGTNGIAGLGLGFNKAFAQNRNDTPLEVKNLGLKLTPKRDPFNP